MPPDFIVDGIALLVYGASIFRTTFILVGLEGFGRKDFDI
jgi:hypothetical protein